MTEEGGLFEGRSTSDISPLEDTAMDHKEPKTRVEKKGRDKQGGHGPYSAKHVRLQAARTTDKKNGK